jgi:hypothetical protein
MLKVIKDKNQLMWALVFAAAATMTSVFVKLSLTTGDLLPGVDGAYYWVQVRSLLDNFSLAFDDLPLVFIAQTGLAVLFGDIQTAVRVSDAVLPALSAIPLFLMARESKSIVLPAVVILAVLINPIQLFYFTGDFIKNAAAIPLVFLLGWILMIWDRVNKKVALVGIASILGTLALSHFGTLLIGALILVLWVLLQLRDKPKQFWVKVIAATLGFSGLVLLLLAVLVPSRFERLVSVLGDPSTIFAQPVWESLIQGRMDLSSAFAVVFGQAAGLVLGLILWSRREALSFSHKSLVFSTILSALFLSAPLLGNEWSGRLAAMAFVPITIAALVLWGSSKRDVGQFALALLAGIAIFSSALMLDTGPKSPVLNTSQYQDFLQLKAEFALPEGALIVASHGLEFLSAWELDVLVVEDTFFNETNQDSYAAIYALTSVRSPVDGGDRPGGSATTEPEQVALDKSELGAGDIDGERPARPQLDRKPPAGAGDTMEAPETGTSDGMLLVGETVYENNSFTLVQIK